MKNKEEFVPIIVPYNKPENRTHRGTALTVTTTVHGDVADEFEKMVEETNSNRSYLLRQMVYHCLGKKDLLEDLKRQLALL